MQQPQVVYVNGTQSQPYYIQAPAPPPQQYVVFVPPNSQSQPYKLYKRGAAKALGIMQIILGVLCIGFNIGLAIVNYNDAWVIAAGWWASPFFILAGCFGIATSCKPNQCTIVTTMTLSILASCCVVGVIVQSSLAYVWYPNYYYCGYPGYWYYCTDGQAAYFALSSLMLLAGVAELVVSIIQACLCCHVCCCKTNTTQVATVAPSHLGQINGGFVASPVGHTGQINGGYVASPVSHTGQINGGFVASPLSHNAVVPMAQESQREVPHVAEIGATASDPANQADGPPPYKLQY